MTDAVIAQKGSFETTLEPGTYWWCACGRSKNQPCCDGSHKGTGLGPLKLEIGDRQTVWLCECKHSGNKPFFVTAPASAC